MNDLSAILTPEYISVILLPALIAGIAVSLCSSLLGVSLVLKRCSMIGDGLSHVGYGTLCIAIAMGWAPMKVTVPVVIAAAYILLRLSESSRLGGDTAIALFSASALALGIFASSKANLTTDVSHYMFGSILAMSRSDVIFSVILSVCVLLVYLLFYDKIFAVTFDENFARATGLNVRFYNLMIAVLTAVTVVLGMMMMGALLISSLMIFPAVTAMRLCKRFRAVVLTAVAVSVSCFLIGLLFSLWFDTAVGASVILVNLLFYIISSVPAALLRKIQPNGNERTKSR
ncbi:MAG: metal ABC transporter permease [Oscillospiraceae bacterium]|nr:metal ABC transporter permease [Oscillospiraceae bacterium]